MSMDPLSFCLFASFFFFVGGGGTAGVWWVGGGGAGAVPTFPLNAALRFCDSGAQWNNEHRDTVRYILA